MQVLLLSLDLTINKARRVKAPLQVANKQRINKTSLRILATKVNPISILLATATNNRIGVAIKAATKTTAVAAQTSIKAVITPIPAKAVVNKAHGAHAGLVSTVLDLIVNTTIPNIVL